MVNSSIKPRYKLEGSYHQLSFMPSAHRLATALRSNVPSFGAWLTLPGTIHARTLARSSPHLDWVLIDCEHGLIPLVPGVAESATAIQSSRGDGTGPSPVVRIPATGTSTGTGWQIKHALDGGARGILVPFVRPFPIVLAELVIQLFDL